MTNIAQAALNARTSMHRAQALYAEGWVVLTEANRLTLRKEGKDAAELILDMGPLAALRPRIRLTGDIGECRLLVEVDEQGRKVLSGENGDLSRNVSADYYSTATRASEGDAEAAVTLPGDWTAVVNCDLRLVFHETEPGVRWQVVPSLKELTTLFDSTPVWESASLFDTDKPTIFVVDDLEENAFLRLGTSAVVSWQSGIGIEEQVSKLKRAIRPVWRKRVLETAHPRALAPQEMGGTALVGLQADMWNRCAGSAWLAFASSIDINQLNAEVEIFGLQRVRHSIPAKGLDLLEIDANASLALFEWADEENAIDQKVSIEQVASLYREDPPWNASRDVLAAASAVFSTLRRDAVGEVLLARRSARSIAIDVARQASDLSSALARSAAERCIASLLAVGGVIAANTVEAITPHQAFQLRLLVGLFLVGLAVWNVFIEGPPALSPIRSLRKDMSKVADLLTTDEQEEVLLLDAVTAAERHATVIRRAVPIAYGICAVLAVVINVA